MSNIPRDPALDSTLAIVREGYDFIWNRCRRLQTDAFRTRVMGLPTVCIHGKQAAELFYDESKLQRRHALPRRVVTTLFGKHAVHTLDDEAHRARKAVFLSLMSDAQLARLMEQLAIEWRAAIRRWEHQPQVVLFDEVRDVMLRGVCAWAGIPLRERELARRGRDMVRMVDAFGGIGPRLWAGKLARARSELWIARQIEAVRAGKSDAAADSALARIARHRDADSRSLGPRTAAVEVLNVIRPTVAISWYVAFAAVALREHPAMQAQLAQEGFGEQAGEFADRFMQEIRRFYPFTPFLGAMVRREFEWSGHTFRKGTLVLLDVHGTNHDPRLWSSPERFQPDRFLQAFDGRYALIPQGGGEHASGHRCPGEWITMHSLTLALHFLTRCMRYQVPPDQDLRIDRRRMPTRPRSGFVIRDVRATELLGSTAPRLPSLSALRAKPAEVTHPTAS
jgi:fatty-acid peroxygenase